MGNQEMGKNVEHSASAQVNLVSQVLETITLDIGTQQKANASCKKTPGQMPRTRSFRKWVKL